MIAHSRAVYVGQFAKKKRMMCCFDTEKKMKQSQGTANMLLCVGQKFAGTIKAAFLIAVLHVLTGDQA